MKIIDKILILFICSCWSIFAIESDDIKKKQTELDKLRKEINNCEKQLEQREKNEKNTLELLDTYDKQLILIKKLTKKLRQEENYVRNDIVDRKTEIEKLENRLSFIKKQYLNYVLAAIKMVEHMTLNY